MITEYVNCQNCSKDCRCKGKHLTPICISFKPTRTLNADRVPYMTTDDLAALCAAPCPPDQMCGRNTVAPLPECGECWRKWLESPVGVDE